MSDGPHYTCPHCHTQVPHGAKVCTGCQAEVEYGAPKEALMAVFVVAIIAGVYLGNRTSAIMGWITFGVLLVGGCIGCFKVFANRVNFKRIYRTRR
jgi:hypothetical protein